MQGCPISRHRFCHFILILYICLGTGCVNESIDNGSPLLVYQQDLADRGAQQRVDTDGSDANEPLGLLQPVDSGDDPDFDVDPNALSDANEPKSLTPSTTLGLQEAITKALSNSPEVRVISFDPSIAEQELIQNTAEFDTTAFGRANYAYDDKPTSSLSEIGVSDNRLFEAGVRQKNTIGGEWSASYLLTRTWDDLPTRDPQTRYEPVLAFQVRQPLMRDAGKDVVLAGVDVARLNHTVALTSFRQRAEEVAAGVVSAYWQLHLANLELVIHEEWLEMARETLTKVEGREGIDATDVQIKQAQSRVWTREGFLIQARRQVYDAQDRLLRLLADPDLNILSVSEISLSTAPSEEARAFDMDQILAVAMQHNPQIAQARLSIDIADINTKVAKKGRMPRLDLVASAGTQTLEESHWNSVDRFRDMDHYSAAIGLSIEYPFKNRSREAEYTRRMIEKQKAVTTLQNLADQIAEQVKQNIRRIESSYEEIAVQKNAAEAARIHMEALEETEEIREKLTAEYLLVKLQAQDTYSGARRDYRRAIMGYNIALSELAKTTGTLLNLHRLQPPAQHENVN
ncbi:TolC family protein [Planctomycetota bacterium]